MKLIEADNDELRGVLPKTYSRIERRTLKGLLKLFTPYRRTSRATSSGASTSIFSASSRPDPAEGRRVLHAVLGRAPHRRDP